MFLRPTRNAFQIVSYFSTKMNKGNNHHYDTIVIGAGIMGSCSAYQLAKSGRKTLLLEQFDYGHNKGSSFGASRIIRYAHTSPLYLSLVNVAYKEWNELERLSNTKLLEQTGMLWIDNKKHTQARHDFLKKHDVEHEFLSGSEIRTRFPHLDYGDDYHAIFDPRAGFLLSDKCVEVAQKQFVSNNGAVHFSEPVVSIIPGDIIRIETNKEKYKCKSLIVTAGAWLNKIFPELQVKTTPLLVGVNFWTIIVNPDMFKPEKKSPCLMISDKEENEFYLIPEYDHQGMIKFGIHDGIALELNKNDRPNAPTWTYTKPAEHMRKHLKYVDTSAPSIHHSCLYTV